MRLKRIKTIFIYTNQPLITSFYIKKVPIFAELAISQRLSAIFCATGVWGLKAYLIDYWKQNGLRMVAFKRA